MDRSDWHSLGLRTGSGSGVIAYEDHDVVTGTEYGYRLRLADNSTTDPVFVVATGPLPTSLALAGIHPNPNMGRLDVSFDVAIEGHVAIELFDLAGRRVHVSHGGLYTPGRHAIVLDSNRLMSGIYFIRLSQGPATVTARMVRVDWRRSVLPPAAGRLTNGAILGLGDAECQSWLRPCRDSGPRP